MILFAYTRRPDQTALLVPMVQMGGDLYTVATLAGHKDIKITQRYAHLSPERLRSAIEVLNSDTFSITSFLF